MCRCLKFWGVAEGVYQTLKTDAQICNIIYSKSSEHFVSTHGGAPFGMVQWSGLGVREAIFEGHKDRVIYAAISPCGRIVLTGSADNQMMFWKVFQGLDQ